MAAVRRCMQPMLRTREACLHRIPFTFAASRWMSTTASKNPKVFFECEVGGKPAGRITFELFADTVPKVLSHIRSQHIFVLY